MKTLTTNFMPKVSIGMPVYNGEPFIREALDSLLEQTFTDFELIISDNASIDNTQEICQEYVAKDNRIQYVRQSKNLGASFNFQFVLNNAVGEYFMWMASDDKNNPTFIEKLYNTMTECDDLVLIMSDVLNISSDGQYLQTSKLENIRINDVKENWFSQKRLVFWEYPTSEVFFCIYGLFKTAILKQCSLNYKNKIKFASASEVPLLAQVSLLGKIASIDEELKIYRRHEKSWFHTEQKKMSLRKTIKLHINIVFCLLSIAINSNNTFFEKVNLMKATLLTFLYRIFSSRLRRIKKASISMFRTFIDIKN